MTTSLAESAPVRIDRMLTHAILRGTYSPGTRLATVRDLAEEHGVNPSTMQRALARLESRGLVTARQGSGVVVNDPVLVGDTSLVPDWLAATSDDPDRAAGILDDLLEVRRLLAVRLIVRHRAEVLAALAEVAEAAVRLLDVPAIEIAAADLHVARIVLQATGNTVALAVLNSLGRALVEVPHLAEAMYEDPARNVSSMLDVVAAIEAGGPSLADDIEATMAAIDQQTVLAFRTRLEAARV